MSDYTYVENVAHALICAEAALCSRMVVVSGKVASNNNNILHFHLFFLASYFHAKHLPYTFSLFHNKKLSNFL